MANKTWNSSEVRELFLSFFEKNAHLRIPAAGLVPKNDPTLLYINSGMAPLKDYFTAAAKPPQKTLVNVQTCIRTRDIDDVGDRHHLTLFEMMGQWSIGDYFKEKACQLSVDLLVNGYGFDQSKLFVTCYGGDESQGIPRDQESYDAWRALGFPEERVVFLGQDNFWGPAGESGPCGPCTEVFYDTGDAYGPAYVPGGEFDSSSRYIEIWNAGVFMQYDKRASGKLDPLPFNSVDTGSGLERMTMILNGLDTVYETDLMKPHMDGIAERLGKAATVRDCRMITDHLRAATFILAEGVKPGNDGRNYIPRRLLRKCIAVTTRAGLPQFDYDGLIHGMVDQMEPFYAHLGQNRQTILKSFNAERVEFERTLSRGLDKLEGLCKGEKPNISGQDAFDLFQSYGLPFDIIRDVVEEKGGGTDAAGYDAAFAQHQKISKGIAKKSGKESPWPQDDAPYRNLDDDAADSEFVGYEAMEGQGRVQVLLVKGEIVEKAEEGAFVEVIVDSTPFYAESGGQAGDQGTIKAPFGQLEVLDCVKVVGRFRVHRCKVASGSISKGEQLSLSVDESTRRDSMNNHSATHIMHAVLRDVLGEHVKQAGSQVDAERLRFDFDHPKRVSTEELAEIERRVNLHIRQNVERFTLETSYDDAVSRGALAFFGDTYGELVRMVKFGEVSTELCGGTHVKRTGDIGSFRIVSEGSVASGVRRIVAVSGRGAMEYTMEQGQMLASIALKLKTKVADIPERIDALTAKKAKPKKAAPAADLSGQAQTAESGTKYVVARLDGGEAADMREEALRIADKIAGVAALLGEDEGKVRMVIAVAKPLTKELNAGTIFKKVAPLIDGRGGGKPHLAQGGGQNPAGIDKLISEFGNAL